MLGRRFSLAAALALAAATGLAPMSAPPEALGRVDSRGPYGFRQGRGNAAFRRAARKRRNVIANRRNHRG